MNEYVEACAAPHLAQLLSDNHPNQQQYAYDNDAPFDPDPLVDVFKAHLQAIQQYQRKVQRQLDKADDQRKAGRSAQVAQMTHLSDMFNKIETAHEQLETRMTDVTTTIARIGERLDIVDGHKRTAEDALQLLKLFIQLNENEAQKFEALLDPSHQTDDRPGWLRAARTLRRLSTVARDVDLPAVATAQSKIQSLAEKLEKDVLDDFDAAFKENELENMNVLFQALLLMTLLLILNKNRGMQKC